MNSRRYLESSQNCAYPCLVLPTLTGSSSLAAQVQVFRITIHSRAFQLKMSLVIPTISAATFFLHGGPYHFNLSFAPDEKVELLITSPISSRQKLKLLMVHM